MSQPDLAADRGSPPRLGFFLLLLLLALAYANHFQNAFHFDDAHTIENNTAIRDLRNIPEFFRDASTFSTIPSNQSYRPLTSSFLALCHAASGGLNPAGFHLAIFLLFLLQVALFLLVTAALLQRTVPAAHTGWVALAATGFYALHPANAETVNYVIASAEILSTLGVLASFALYLMAPRWRRSGLFVLPAALGILAKPPAAIFPVLLLLYAFLFRRIEPGGFRQFLRRDFWPALLVCGAILGFVGWMTPRTWVAGAADASGYLQTQPYVILRYFLTFLWPADLSADYDLGPLGGANDPRMWAGFVFLLILVVSIAWLSRRPRGRLGAFGLGWFLLALLPTSLTPLAEVMNSHRPFMAYLGLALAGAALLDGFLENKSRQARTAAMAVVVICLLAGALFTFKRNRIWRTEESLWRDVAAKSPNNPRGLMNYGNTLMARGDFAGALDYFHRALKLAPRYPTLLINIAIAEAATRKGGKAEDRFLEARRLAPDAPSSYTFYARHLLAYGRTAEARALLEKAAKLSPSDQTVQDLLRRAGPATPESFLAQSLQLYREGRFVESIAASESALALRPGYAEAWNNIGAAYNEMREHDKAVAACERALALKPDFTLARNNLEYARERLRKNTVPP